MGLVQAEATVGTSPHDAASVRPATKGVGVSPLPGRFGPNSSTAAFCAVGEAMGLGNNGLQRSGRCPMDSGTDVHPVGFC